MDYLNLKKKGKGYQVYEYDIETGKESEKDVVKKIEVKEQNSKRNNILEIKGNVNGCRRVLDTYQFLN